MSYRCSVPISSRSRKPCGGDQAQLGAFALDQSIGDQSGAVNQVGNIPESEASFLYDHFQAGDRGE